MSDDAASYNAIGEKYVKTHSPAYLSQARDEIRAMGDLASRSAEKASSSLKPILSKMSSQVDQAMSNFSNSDHAGADQQLQAFLDEYKLMVHFCTS